MSTRRDKLVKVRFTEDEFSRLETLRQSAGSESCAVFVRRKALEPEIGTGAIAALVGQIGVTLNAEEIAPKKLEHLADLLFDLTQALRKMQRT